MLPDDGKTITCHSRDYVNVNEMIMDPLQYLSAGNKNRTRVILLYYNIKLILYNDEYENEYRYLY